MNKFIYSSVGCIAGILIGFIAFTIYFQPLLESKKIGLENLIGTVLPYGFLDKVNDSSLANANTAFRSMNYEAASEIIATELSISIEAGKLSEPKAPFSLTIAMLGACLATAEEDVSRAKKFEEAATKICDALNYIESCEVNELYEFIRRYTSSNTC